MPVLILVVAALSSAHPQSCDRYVEPSSVAERIADAALISQSGHATRASAIEVVLAADRWRIVWVTPDGAEPGVFFFQGPPGARRLVDVWGGVTADRRGAERWAARTVRAPAGLAHCFARRLVEAGP